MRPFLGPRSNDAGRYRLLATRGRRRPCRYGARIADSTPHPKAKPWPDDHRPTAFQVAVVAAVEALEPGDLVSFSDLADQIGRPGSGQAVANVLRGAPDLPWWRVLPSDGRVYRNLATAQVPLLRAEGRRVDDQRRVHPAT